MLVSALAVRPLARRQRGVTPRAATRHLKYVAMAREPALCCAIGPMSPFREDVNDALENSTRGHDPRQIDLLAIVAMIVVVIAVGAYLSEPVKTRLTSGFIEPSQSVRW